MGIGYPGLNRGKLQLLCNSGQGNERTRKRGADAVSNDKAGSNRDESSIF